MKLANITLAPTIRKYNKENLVHDVITGLIIMAVSIPISMGYAQIAGLPAVYGLYGSVFPILLFALFSTSPQFVFGVDAAPAALVGSALLGMNIEGGSKEALAVVPVLTIFRSCVAFCILFNACRKACQLYIRAGDGWIYYRYLYNDYFDAGAKAYGWKCRNRRILGTGGTYYQSCPTNQYAVACTWECLSCDFTCSEKACTEVSDGGSVNGIRCSSYKHSSNDSVGN